MIYKLRFDRFNFLQFHLSPAEIKETLGDMFILDNAESWSEFWKPLKGKFSNDSENRNVTALPDVTLWFTDEIIANEKAYKILKEALSEYGEWLPLLIEGINYWLLHVTEKLEMEYVDVENSIRTIDRAGDIDVEKLIFNKNKISDLLIFKTEYNDYKNIYCTDTFKKLIESNDLQGLTFSNDMSNSPY